MCRQERNSFWRVFPAGDARPSGPAGRAASPRCSTATGTGSAWPAVATARSSTACSSRAATRRCSPRTLHRSGPARSPARSNARTWSIATAGATCFARSVTGATAGPAFTGRRTPWTSASRKTGSSWAPCPWPPRRSSETGAKTTLRRCCPLTTWHLVGGAHPTGLLPGLSNGLLFLSFQKGESQGGRVRL